MHHAMLSMIAQQLHCNLIERSACGVNLRQYIYTVGIFLDHARDTAYLTFCPTQSFEDGLCMF